MLLEPLSPSQTTSQVASFLISHSSSRGWGRGSTPHHTCQVCRALILTTRVFSLSSSTACWDLIRCGASGGPRLAAHNQGTAT